MGKRGPDVRTPTHVVHLELSPPSPWEGALAGLTQARSDLADDCPRCAEIAQQLTQVENLGDRLDALSPAFMHHERAMIQLQSELRIIRGELSRVVRTLRDQAKGHIRCGCCGLGLAENSATHPSAYRKEPYGLEIVCVSCYEILQETHTSARDQRLLDTLKDREEL